MKIITNFLFLIIFSSNLFAQQEFLTLNYDSDKSKITARHLSQLESFFKKLSSKKIEKINIVGHTDTTANIYYNQNLSRKRATKVQSFFLSKGIPPNQIQISWQGESQSISPKNLREDRRVVIEVFFPIKKIEIVEAIIEVDKPILTTPVSDLFKKTSIPIQEFCINPKKDTTIQCAQGTIINIQANSFALNSIQSRNKNCVRFQVKEVFLFSDMILENLTTTSDGQILETQGMIYTNAILENDTLSLKKDIDIFVPIDDPKLDAKIFDGTRNPHSDVINWTVNNNSVLRNFDVFELDNCLKYNALWQKCNNKHDYISIQPDLTGRCLRRIILCGGVKKCHRCKIIFCRFPKRILKPFHGMFSREVRSGNKHFRQCQRMLRRQERYARKRDHKNLRKLCASLRDMVRQDVLEGVSEPNKNEKELLELTDLIERSDSLIRNGLVNTNLISRCNELDKLFKEYEVENVEDLLMAINQPLLDEFNVTTMEQLLDTLPKVNFENLEVAYRNETISFEDYKFYVFNISSLGWKNIDIFHGVKDINKTKLTVNLLPSREVDCKLVFKKQSYVLPAKLADDHFYFDGIPKNEEAWIVAIKYENGQPILAMKEIVVKKKSFDLEFEKLTLEELKVRLKVLDFKE
ncbi:MAG: OmpA family protein [Saprospiraceae bacterium]